MIIYLDENEIKQQLVLMLKHTVAFFDANNIRYSIMSGTMLGAVRHKGFIPWDDDIDIAVLREDYNKLIKILRDPNIVEKPDAVGFELGNHVIPFIKIVNPQINVEEKLMRGNQKLWIDIFPFDGTSQNKKKAKCDNFLIKKVLRRIYFFSNEEYYTIHPRDCNYKIYNYLLYAISKVFSPEEITKKYIKICSRIKTTDAIFVEDYTWGNKSVPKKIFEELSDYQFENIAVKGFKDYDTYLKCIYDEYMKLPPENQRVNHGIKAWRISKNEK